MRNGWVKPLFLVRFELLVLDSKDPTDNKDNLMQIL